MQTRWTILLFIAGPLLALLLVFAGVILSTSTPDYIEYNLDVFDFDSCVAEGYPVMESFPRQCRTDDNRIFVENIYTDA